MLRTGGQDRRRCYRLSAKRQRMCKKNGLRVATARSGTRSMVAESGRGSSSCSMTNPALCSAAVYASNGRLIPHEIHAETFLLDFVTDPVFGEVLIELFVRAIDGLDDSDAKR